MSRKTGKKGRDGQKINKGSILCGRGRRDPVWEEVKRRKVCMKV